MFLLRSYALRWTLRLGEATHEATCHLVPHGRVTVLTISLVSRSSPVERGLGFPLTKSLCRGLSTRTLTHSREKAGSKKRSTLLRLAQALVALLCSRVIPETRSLRHGLSLLAIVLGVDDRLDHLLVVGGERQVEWPVAVLVPPLGVRARSQ